MSAKNELDQYYTNPDYAIDCYAIAKQYASHGSYVEPCAGTGSFYNLMPVDGRLGIDLEPKCDGVVKGNYLDHDWLLDNCNVVSNPPFGFNAGLAVAFFNKCASDGAHMIAMVLPRTFRKASITNKLARNYVKVHDTTAPDNAFILDGEAYDVPCCFQVWIRQDTDRELIDTSHANPWFDWTTKEEADFAIRRVGGRAGQLLDGLDHSGTTTYFVKAKGSKAQLGRILARLDLSKERENTAGVRSVAKYEVVNNIRMMNHD